MHLNRWKGETVCIAASGPSLVHDDVWEAYEAGCKLIVINDTWRACASAHVLYAADCRWWISPAKAPNPDQFRGERWTTSRAWPDKHQTLLKTLNQVYTKHGCDLTDCEPISTGHNSSFQATGLAALWGVRRIIYTGLDMKCDAAGRDHWHGAHEGLSSPRFALPRFKAAFEHVAPQLAARGIEVINASRDTALKCFPRLSMTEALR